MILRISAAVLFFVNTMSITRLAFVSLLSSALVGTVLSLFSKKDNRHACYDSFCEINHTQTQLRFLKQLSQSLTRKHSERHAVRV